MNDPNDDLQRYLDILFADYRQTEPADRLHTLMLKQMRREKQRLRDSGMSEKEAVTRVLNRASRNGAQAEGSLLVYTDRFARDSAWSLLQWSLVGLVFSVPLLVLGMPLFPILLLLATLFAAFWAWHYTSGRDSDNVSFFTYESMNKLRRGLWLGFGALALLLTIGALFPPDDAEGKLKIVGGALRVARFYRPWLLLVFPLWGSGLQRLMLKNEVKK